MFFQRFGLVGTRCTPYLHRLPIFGGKSASCLLFPLELVPTELTSPPPASGLCARGGSTFLPSGWLAVCPQGSSSMPSRFDLSALKNFSFWKARSIQRKNQYFFALLWHFEKSALKKLTPALKAPKKCPQGVRPIALSWSAPCPQGFARLPLRKHHSCPPHQFLLFCSDLSFCH